MAATTNPSTQNKQGWIGAIASSAYKYSFKPLVDGVCCIGNKAKEVSGATSIATKFLIASGTLSPALEGLAKKYNVVKLAGNLIPGISPSGLKYIAAKAINGFLPNKIIYYNGKDLNPLHLQQRIEETNATTLIPVTEAPPADAANAPTQLHSYQINKTIQEELKPENVEKYKNKAKKLVKEKLCPVATNYARAYWLFSSVMGNNLKSEGKNNNQALMEIVNTLRLNHNNNFSLSVFRKVLNNRGIKISWWQTVKLYLAYPLLGSWITKILISTFCNRSINMIYDNLFDVNGKKQETLLVNSSEQISHFLDKYSQLLEEHSKSGSPNSQAQFIAERINKEDMNKLYADFSETIIRNFIPSIGRNIIQPEIDQLAENFGISTKSTFTAKATFFFLTIPIRIFKWIGWIIDAPIRKVAQALIEDIGPTIVESTMATLQSPITQMNLKETILTQLKELKEVLEASEETTLDLPFSAAKNSDLHIHLRRVAESISKILAYKIPDSKIDANTILEQLLKNLNKVGDLKIGEKIINQIISSALITLLPQVCLTTLCKYLHPKQFTEEVVSKLVDVTTSGFSPSPPFNEATKAKNAAIEIGLNEVIHDLSKIAVERGLEEVIEDKVAKPILAENLQFPKVSKKDVPQDQLINIKHEVDQSFIPRTSKYLTEGINCLFDKNMESYGIFYVMRIINSVFQRS